MTNLDKLKELREVAPAGFMTVPTALIDKIITDLEATPQTDTEEIDQMQRHLPVTQFLIYRQLALAGGRIVSLDTLRREASKTGSLIAMNSLLVHICYLRKALSEMMPGYVIENLRGRGYCLEKVA